MKGRKPKPTALQISEGDPRKLGANKLKEKLAAQPKAMRGFPPAPEHLSEMSRKMWDFLSEQIEIMNQDHRPDALMLEGLCVNYARAVKADKEIERDGVTIQESTIDEESGERILLGVKANPACAVSDKAWKLVRAFCTEFGLSPSSITRLKIEKPEDETADLKTLLFGASEQQSAVH